MVVTSASAGQGALTHQELGCSAPPTSPTPYAQGQACGGPVHAQQGAKCARISLLFEGGRLRY